MGFKIVNRGFAEATRLLIEPDRVKFIESGSFGAKTFTYDQIACVMLGRENYLSFQVGREVFSVQTKPDDADHQAAIAALVAAVKQTLPASQPAAT